MMSHLRMTACCLVAAAMAVAECGAALQPANLRCEHRVNPLGIDDVSPRLSWELQSDGRARGEIQSAYEIRVGSSAGLADLWNSGKIISRETVDIAYAGQPLPSGKRCFWQVRVYDGSDNASPWSGTAQWSMGLLSATNWTAQWIGYDAAYSVPPDKAAENALFNASGLSFIKCPGAGAQSGLYHSALRKQITLPSGDAITNAAFALYADNTCGVYVNGQAAPGIAARWEATARINVTALLHSGNNVLALSATNTDANPASVIGRLVVQFASGSVSNFPVDGSWKAAQFPAAGWYLPSFDASAWTGAESTGTPWGTPSLHDVPRIPAPYLRKEFSVNQAITRATVYVTSLGAYELRLNGKKVGTDDVLTPGWSHFTKRVYYQTYDVSSLVRYGSNCIGAVLGDGWYASNLAFKGQRLNYGGNPRFIGQLVIETADGQRRTIVTDGSWKASYGPIRHADLLLGTEYDARLEMPGWDLPGFNESSWASVVTGLSSTAARFTDVTSRVAGMVSNNQLNFVPNNTNMGGDPAYGVLKTLKIDYVLGGTNLSQSFVENTTVKIGGGGFPLTISQAVYGDASMFPGVGGLKIEAAVTEPSRRIETLNALSVTEPSPGSYTFDLGQNMVGWVRVKISGKAGERITVRHGEMLNPSGTVYTANLRGANSTDFFILATNGVSVLEPMFTFHGFRYVELRGLSTAPDLDAVTGIVVHSDMTRAGDFSCSNPLVNQLFHNIIWGQKGNYLETPTDCPQRDERMGWTGDAQFFAPTAAYNFDVQSFFRRYITTLCEDSQRADGAFAFVAPDLGQGNGGTAWGDAGWICPYLMYQAYGDTNIIAEHYAAMQRWGQFVAASASGYIVPSLPGDFGDWVNLGGGASSTVMDTAYYAYYARAMSEMAAALGRTADAATYSTLHSNIVSAFGTLYNSDGSFKDGSSQTGYALAFSLGLVPASLRAQAADIFADTIARFGNHLATGFIGTPRILPALHAAGRDDLAYLLLLQETYPSWLYQVTLGATTMWERWDGWTPSGGFQTIGMNSFNHYAFGSVGEYLYGGVGGIKPGSPGYRTIKIQPVTGNGLTWANTRYSSIRGLISTAWTNTSGKLDLKVVIPPNTSAEVSVPTGNPATVTESGLPAQSAPGVTYLGTSNNHAIYLVGSGEYHWKSTLPVPPQPSVVITSTNQVGTGSGTFYPAWPLVTNGSLIAYKLPSTMSGNFSMETSFGNRNVKSLTDGGSLGIRTGGSPVTTSTNYVTCGNGNGAGSMVVYTLDGSSTGFDLTNIVVYGGWGDNGRDQQAYTVSYSTVDEPAKFVLLTRVNVNPSIAGNLQSATRVSIDSPSGVLAKAVAAVKFDFTSPESENGYCGYAEITVFGTPTVPPPPRVSAVFAPQPGGFILSVSDLRSDHGYMLQSTTNLTSGAWLTESNLTAVQSLDVPISILTNDQKYYRVVGY